MKNFTKKSTSDVKGYLSSTFRFVALSLIAMLWVHSTAFAQLCSPPPQPVHFNLSEVESCYKADNSYMLEFSTQYFENVDSFEVVANFDASRFEVLGITTKGVLEGTSQWAHPLRYEFDNTAGTITFHWEEPVTSGKVMPVADKHVLADIKFGLKNYPNNSLPNYHTDLTWNASSKAYYCVNGDNFTEVAPSLLVWNNGYINTTLKYDDITYTVVPEKPICPADEVLVTITSPTGTGYKYTFNGGSNWFTSNKAQSEPGTNKLQVQDADGCLSIVEYHTIEGPEPIVFSTVIEPERCSNQGAITFYPQGGSGDYKYIVRPRDEDWDDLADLISKFGQDEPNYLGSEGRYQILAYDANCPLTYDYLHHNSRYVNIGSEATFSVTTYSTDIVCYDTPSGSITINVGGAVSGTIYASLDGAVPVEVVNGIHTFDGLTAGEHTVDIFDNVCSTIVKKTINNADLLVFEVGYEDASCDLFKNGEIWITSVSGTVVSEVTNANDWEFVVQEYGTTTQTTSALTDTVKNLGPNNYYVWLRQISTGCEVAYKNNNNLNQNIVPVFTDGVITFDAYVSNAECENGAAIIGVKNVKRTCDSCNDGAQYEFTIVPDSTTWLPIDQTFTGVTPGDYSVYVRDATESGVCSIAQEITVGDIVSLTVTIGEITPPTCKDGNDGRVKMYVSGGTAPYEYSVDNAPNWRKYPTFGLTEGPHLLQIRDAIGCVKSMTIDVPYLDPIELEVSVGTLTCYGETTSVSVSFSSTTTYSDVTVYRYYYSTDGDPIANGSTFVPAEKATGATNPTMLGEGTYYIQAKDPNGCVSNIVKLVIGGVKELKVLPPVVEDANCYGTWSGRVTLEAADGNITSSTYMYAYANNPDYFSNPDADIQWYEFDDATVTTTTVEFQKGEYWFVIKDNCDISDPVQVIVDGYDAIEVVGAPTVQYVKCNDGNDATITIDEGDVVGGAPGYGVAGSHYLYTLYNEAGVVEGTAQQVSNEYSGLAAGTYTLVVYDSTDPKADPAQCPPDTATIIVKEPMPLEFETNVKHISCYDEEDGEIYVYIQGGIGGTWGYNGQHENYETDGNKYKVTINGITGQNYNYSLELKDAIDTVVFQVMDGMFELKVEDAYGCVTTQTVMVAQPNEWNIDYTLNPPTDCDTGDGTISLTITGGYARYEIPTQYSIDGVNWFDATMEYGEEIGEFEGSVVTATGTVTDVTYGQKYTIYVRDQYPNSILEEALSKYPSCMDSIEVDVKPFNPYSFDVDVECVKCYGDSTGIVTFSNISGGNATGYQVQVTGPFPEGSTVSDVSMAYEPNNDDKWWPKDNKGNDVYTTTITLDTLKVGTYLVYLRDNAGYTLARCCRPVEFEICEPDSLELVKVNLLKNVNCKGDATGEVEISAKGGVPPYEYNYTYTTILDNNYQYQGQDAIVEERWQSESVFTGLKAGAYIGWVRDANGCITGCEINSNGLPIDDHRAVVSEAGDIIIEDIVKISPECYGGDASVEIFVAAGSLATGTYTFVVEGMTYEGDAFSHTYDPVAVGKDSYELGGFKVPDADGYTIKLKTNFECEADGYVFTMTQPDVFSVDAKIATGALCPGDKDVLVTIETIGGTAPFVFDIYRDGELDRTGSQIVNHVMYVGSTYSVVATDAEGCQQIDVLDIPVPIAVDFLVKDVSCYGDAKASALITVTKSTSGRTHEVRFAQKLQGGHGSWSKWIAFDQDYTIDTLSYGNNDEYDGHYIFEVRDNNYCPAVDTFVTFVPVQTELKIIELKAEDDMLSVEALGGMVDKNLDHNYMYAAVKTDDISTATKTWQASNAFTDLDYAEYTIYVRDFNLCETTKTVTAGATEHTLAEVNGTEDTSQVIDRVVKVMGTITGIVDGEGFFMQDANAARSGIWVATDMTADLTIGDGAMVYGKVAEVNNITAVVADKVVKIDAPVAVEPMVVSSPKDVKNEDYESMLVKVEGARAEAADENGMWKVYYEMDDNAMVNKWMYAYTPEVGNFYDVTGVVNGKNDGYYIEPRMAEDVVDLTATPNNPEIDAVKFTVYPNPFNDNINIDNADKLSRVVISNIVGQKLVDINNPVRTIRTQNLVSGVYVVSLYTESGLVKTERIVKR